MVKRIDSRRIDLTGQKFDDLKVVKLSDQRHKNGTLMWECICSCGKTVYLLGGALRGGIYKSCGCKLKSKRDQGARKHEETDRVDGTRKSALKAKLHKANKSGHKGVMWVEGKQKWKAYIGIGGKSISLGYFVNKDDAIAARKAGEEKYHKPYLEDK